MEEHFPLVMIKTSGEDHAIKCVVHTTEVNITDTVK